ncbi:RidA family protein [Acetobacter sp. AN02]|uniref:RidA family protein n=1 Tax=Acetobacter sp. AN02 TaxID=2894186 RepID=UPI002434343A|nr:RidA family protein [Acetobacter sp. AN02]MDG6094737.1 RidA family protein [Acetobacter sp. AN02]
MKISAYTLSVLAAGIVSVGAARAEGVIRHVDPAGHFPIATAVEVPAGATTVYLSGMGAPVSDKSADPKSLRAYGDMEAQTAGALTRIQSELGKIGLKMGDVIKMQVFMVSDKDTGKLDFAGMMKSYKKFFGTAGQPNLPVRSAFEVAHLANPGWLIEIEVTAVRSPS